MGYPSASKVIYDREKNNKAVDDQIFASGMMVVVFLLFLMYPLYVGSGILFYLVAGVIWDTIKKPDPVGWWRVVTTPED
jgi:hypothetical protein